MLDLPSRRHLLRERGQESERPLSIPLVLRQMKSHAPDEMPDIAMRPQPSFQGFARLVRDLRRQLLPERHQQVLGDILCSLHRR